MVTGLCNETNVGVRDELKVIGNNQMTASTDKGTDFLPKFGRLLGTNAWCPNITDEDPYLQIDLGKKYDICAVEVQGEPGALLTTSFTLNSSTDGVTFTEYNSNEVISYSRIFVIYDPLSAVLTLSPKSELTSNFYPDIHALENTHSLSLKL